MTININDLQRMIGLLLRKLQDSKGDTIDIEGDFYWAIAPDEIYNPYLQPENMTLGQLSDDWSELLRLSDPDKAIPYDLARIAAVLKVLSIEQSIGF